MKTKAAAERFQNLHFLAIAHNYDDGLDVILETLPDIVFLEINPDDTTSNLSLEFINELHRYLKVIPKIFITTSSDSLCYKAFKFGVYDYFTNPVEVKELRKSLFRLDKDLEQVVSLLKEPLTEFSKPIQNMIVVSNDKETDSEAKTADETEEISEKRKLIKLLRPESPKENPLVICVKSYGDYRYIDAKDIAYLQADNNSTDIHLNGGEMITAFKTLKHFEGVLKYPFVRIHNSYIVNIDYISRIHTGNTVCHIKNSTTKLPFSKSYKENIDAIIATIASGNYLEI